MITIGIDVGGSQTKIVGFDKAGNLIAPMMAKASDPITSIYGALGKFTTQNSLQLGDIEKIMVTGVGAAHLEQAKDLYGCRWENVSEFDCVGRGGLYLSELPRAIVLSMGTGTAIVYADSAEGYTHLGGTGIGGGTLKGLSKKLLGMDNLENVIAIAENGQLSNVDLRISDIVKQHTRLSLPAEMTAANFGKMSDLADKEDIALGLINMVFETAGMMAYFAAKSYNIRDVVVTGYLSTLPQTKHVFEGLNSMFGMNFIVPAMSEYATVIGASLSKR